MSESLELIGENRNSLLLAEIGCWLHMMGKLYEEFPVSKSRDKRNSCRYDYQKCLPQKLDSTLDDLITNSWIRPILSTIPHIPDAKNFPLDFSLFSFVKEHRNRRGVKTSILKALVDAHGIASGIEKGVSIEEMSQYSNKTFISTAFGYEYQNIMTDLCWATPQGSVCRILKKTLKRIRNKNGNLSEDEWWNLVSELREKLEKSYLQVLGDTRRPINHISLFDQTVSTVAFFRAELASIVLERWRDPLIKDFDKKYKFKLLLIRHNGLKFWGETDTVGDLRARKGLIEKMVLQTEKLITCKYPIGYIAYKDENNLVFLISDDRTDILSLKAGTENLESIIERQSSSITNAEVIPLLKITNNANRWGANLGEVLSAGKGEPRMHANVIARSWESESEEICTVCRVRPVGKDPKAKKRKICDVCLHRREKRSERWSNELETTIWIDEVSDTNGRIALIAGRFDIEKWIGGQLINTLLGRLLPSVSCTWNLSHCDFEKITEEIQKELSESEIGRTTYLKSFLEGTNIVKGITGDPSEKNHLKLLYDLLVVHREPGGQPLEDPSSKENAELLFQAIFAQEPSFARIRRIWETTRKFWRDILPTEDDIAKSEISEAAGKKGPRFLITGEIKPHPNELGRYHACELIVKETRMSVIWDPIRQGFITIDNLEYITELLGIQDVKHEIKGELKIEEPTGYGARDKQLGTILVEEVQEVGGEYIPAIPLLAEPSTFMALVPADKALDVVKIIKQKYEREMGKVRNRLPITLGIIFSHKYTPLRVIIDAGQRFLTGMQSEQPSQYFWNVIEEPSAPQNPPFNDKSFAKTTQILMERQDKTLEWDVPLRMGDGTTDDHWYPYVFLEGNPGPRNRSLKAVFPWTGELKWLVHADDIRKGDLIHFTPSLFDFQWLDAGSRRFEIAYEDGRRLGEKGVGRPYLLESVDTLERLWESLQKGLKNSQIHALRDTIEQKRKQWNPSEEDCRRHGTFWRFCRDVIATSHWITVPWGADNKKECLDTWADYAVHGWLNDSIEIYMQIMKKRSQTGSVNHV